MCPNRTISCPHSKMIHFHQYLSSLHVRNFGHYISLLTHMRHTVDLNHKSCSYLFALSHVSFNTQNKLVFRLQFRTLNLSPLRLIIFSLTWKDVFSLYWFLNHYHSWIYNHFQLSTNLDCLPPIFLYESLIKLFGVREPRQTLSSLPLTHCMGFFKNCKCN